MTVLLEPLHMLELSKEFKTGHLFSQTCGRGSRCFEPHVSRK